MNLDGPKAIVFMGMVPSRLLSMEHMFYAMLAIKKFLYQN